MAFVKSLAKGGLFGLAGLAATSGGDKNKPKPSLTTGDMSPPSGSLVNSSKGIY